MTNLTPINRLTRIALLLALTLAVQGLRLPPPLTGPMVNFMLIFSTALAGTAGGAAIGLFTPGAALLLGIIPPLLAPAIPFIMVGNAFYCFVFGVFSRGSKARALIGLAVGSLLKFAVIAGAARYLLQLPSPVAETLALPQLFNAFLGGTPALLLSLKLKHIGTQDGRGS